MSCLRRWITQTINTNTTKQSFMLSNNQMIPCPIIAWATFMKPAILAPFT